MALPKFQSVEQRVLIITDELMQGKKPADFVKLYCRKWKCSTRMLDRYIEQARPVAEKRFKEEQELKENVRKDEIIKAARQSIITDLEVEAILCGIVKGQLIDDVIRKQVENPNGTFTYTEKPIVRRASILERIKASDLLFKKWGSYAPEKKEHSGTLTVDSTPFSIKKRSAVTGGQ